MWLLLQPQPPRQPQLLQLPQLQSMAPLVFFGFRLVVAVKFVVVNVVTALLLF
jgi:hypothetical protein